MADVTFVLYKCLIYNIRYIYSYSLLEHTHSKNENKYIVIHNFIDIIIKSYVKSTLPHARFS